MNEIIKFYPCSFLCDKPPIFPDIMSHYSASKTPTLSDVYDHLAHSVVILSWNIHDISQVDLC